MTKLRQKDVHVQHPKGIGREMDRIKIESTARLESCEAVLSVSDFRATHSGQTAIRRQAAGSFDVRSRVDN